MSQQTAGDKAENPFSPPDSDIVAPSLSEHAQLRVEYRLGLWDYYQFSLFTQFTSPVLQVFLMGTSIFVAYQMKTFDTAIITAFMVYVLSWVLQLVLTGLMAIFGKFRTVLSTYCVEPRTNALYVETEFGQFFNYWSAIQRISKGPGFTALYLTSASAYIIPNRAFESSSQRLQFIDQVSARIAKSKSEEQV